jgi:NAD(P)H-binding
MMRSIAAIRLFWLWSTSTVVALSSSGAVDRRSIVQGAGVAAAFSFFRPEPSFAANTSLVVPKNKAVVVLGANGKTGRECVKALLNDGRPCIATTRAGDFVYEGSTTAGLTIAKADVTSLESLRQVITKDVGAVIFAASTSAKGGNSAAVDRDGVLNTAEACIAADVQRLVVVSSGGVSRPDSAIYKLLNFAVKGVMEAKIQGEDGMREMYAAPSVLEKKLGYTVIRPGGLLLEDPVGASRLELNQGDSKSGRLPRADVASLCVQCLSSASAWDATFECYEAVTAKPIESVGLSNILRSTDATTFTSGKERRGNSWEELFNGLERDPGHVI